jgi:hypothetical protein
MFYCTTTSASRLLACIFASFSIKPVYEKVNGSLSHVAIFKIFIEFTTHELPSNLKLSNHI